MGSVRWAFPCAAWRPCREEWLLAARLVQPEEKDRIGQFVFARDAKAALVRLPGVGTAGGGFPSSGLAVLARGGTQSTALAGAPASSLPAAAAGAGVAGGSDPPRGRGGGCRGPRRARAAPLSSPLSRRRSPGTGPFPTPLPLCRLSIAQISHFSWESMQPYKGV